MKGNDNTPKKPTIVRRWEDKTLPSPDPDPGAAYFVEDDTDEDIAGDLSEKGKRIEVRLVESVEAHRYPAREMTPFPAPPGWPEPMGEAAFHGPAGEIIRSVTPYTEGADEALLADFLTTFGILVGRGPYFRLGGGIEQPRLNTTIVGDTARGRKGAARSVIERITEHADWYEVDGVRGVNLGGDWMENHSLEGLTSGEGLIAAIQANKRDGRMLIVESELARLYTVAGRDGSTLSPIIRNAFDKNRLQIKNKNSPMSTNNAYVGIVANITQGELMKILHGKGAVEAVNGFGNRFLYISARRPYRLAVTALPVPLIDQITMEVRDRVRAARRIEEMYRNDRASKLWTEWYNSLAEPDGLYGMMTSRLDNHALRVSQVYAMFDGTKVINSKHIEAAFEVIRYADDSARFIIGTSTGNHIADTLLAELRLPVLNAKGIPTAARKTLTRVEQFALFNNKIAAPDLEYAISLIVRAGFAEEVEIKTPGRPKKVLQLVGDERVVGGSE